MQTKLQYMLRLLAIVVINLCVITMVGYAYYNRDTREQSVQVLSKVGSSGEEVRQVQQALKNRGYNPGAVDGKYGEATAQAVRKFQRDKGLTVDGIAGNATLKALGITSGALESGNSALSGTYRQGNRGDGVLRIQTALQSIGYYTGSLDGIFGSGTTNAVKAYQRNKGLTADGIVGTATLRSLGLTSSSVGGVSDSDYQLLARLVSAEARGESYQGQVAVAAVILNRTEHPSFPDTIPGVAYQVGEFSVMTNGQINQPVADSAYRAAKDAMNGSDPSGGAIYYYNPKKTSNQWLRARPVIKSIGAHVFCA